MWEDVEAVKDVVDHFFSKQVETVDKLRVATGAASADLEELRTGAHKVKGGAKYVHALSIIETAHIAEQECLARIKDGLSCDGNVLNHVQDLVNEFDRLAAWWKRNYEGTVQPKLESLSDN